MIYFFHFQAALYNCDRWCDVNKDMMEKENFAYKESDFIHIF